jgi:tRNA (adenine-N(1)-)-methyltransferase non-catalytic subunit
VRQLCENSSTFHAKTAFAQEKYKKKKLAKHLTRVRARFPSARAICEAYFYKQPAAINYLRYDALGMLLSLGNVGADAAPLVVETCGGLVVATAADRMGGRGRLCAAHAGAEKATMDIARLMNLTDAARESIVTCALGDLIKARSDPEAWSVEAKTREEAAVEARAAIEADKAAKLAAAGGDVAIGAPTRKKPEGWRSRRIRDAAPGDVSAMCRDDEGFTSLIIASPALDPSVALDALLPLLAPSAPFAVWNPASGPLAEALEALRSTHAAVGLALHEPWLRKHQARPHRTLVPIRPRSRCELHSLRTFSPGVRLSPLAPRWFRSRDAPRRLSTPPLTRLSTPPRRRFVWENTLRCCRVGRIRR